MNSALWSTIRRLFEVEKLSRRAIAHRLGLHRATVRRALSSTQGAPRPKPRSKSGSDLLRAHVGYLDQRLKDYPELSGRKLFEEIRQQGYGGSYTTLKNHLQPLRARPQAFLRLETPPGEFAQVDWANVGTIPIGSVRRKLSCFVMVLSYSRMLYLEFTLSQCLEDFLACHVHAFDFFGGVPKRINYDNLKTVVLSRVGPDIRFHPQFMDFAGAYLFEPIPCNVRAAWEKGKVESAIKYIRSSFLAGLTIEDGGRLGRDAAIWRDTVANARIHGATRQQPLDRFQTEKPLLQPLPAHPYDTRIIRTVKATRQALVHFESNRYSVPWIQAGRTMTLKAAGYDLWIFNGIQEVAHHRRSYEKHGAIENPAHYEGLLAERKKAHAAKHHAAFLALAPECAAYLTGLAQSELNLPGQLAKIQGLLERYGKTEVAGAVAHALTFRAFGASYLQRIIHQKRAARNMSEPQPIVLTKKPDWSRLAVEQTDLSLYDELFEEQP